MTNCPNCTAPITGPKCEYCGTVLIDDVCDVDIAKLDQLLNYGAITPNQAREMLGLEPLDAKTELLKQQMIMRQLYDNAIRAMRAYTGETID